MALRSRSAPVQVRRMPQPSTTSRRSSTSASRRAKVRPGRLANWMGVSAPSVTVALQRLERDGWLTIAEDRSVTLTEKGEELAARRRARPSTARAMADRRDGPRLGGGRRRGAGTSRPASRSGSRIGSTSCSASPRTCPHGNIDPRPQAALRQADCPGRPAARRRRRTSDASPRWPSTTRPTCCADLRDYGLMTGSEITLASASAAWTRCPSR